MRLFTARSWLVAVGGAVAALIFISIPTAVLASPLFARMTPVRTQDYVFWALTSILTGLLVATFTLTPGEDAAGKALSGVLLSDLAIGCPVCNKLVVLALGTSGALNLFAPAQFFIGVASVAVLAWAFVVRSRAIIAGCQVSPSVV